MANDPYVKRLLWFVFAGSRGGLNRLRIINAITDVPMNINQLAEKLNRLRIINAITDVPMNINQLAEKLNLDYKAIQHHVRVLEKNNLVSKEGEKYGVLYFISPLLENNMKSLEEIVEKLEKSK